MAVRAEEGRSTLASEQGDWVLFKDECFRLNWASQGFKTIVLRVR